MPEVKEPRQRPKIVFPGLHGGIGMEIGINIQKAEYFAYSIRVKLERLAKVLEYL